MGWFSIDDLIRWSYDSGPIVIVENDAASEEQWGTWHDTRAYDLAA